MEILDLSDPPVNNASTTNVIETPAINTAPLFENTPVLQVVSKEQPGFSESCTGSSKVASSPVYAVTEAPKVVNLPIPEFLLVDCHPNQYKLFIIKLLLVERDFYRKFKLHFQEKYREKFKNMWREGKSIILMNFIFSFLGGSFEQLNQTS